ncbi:MAG: Gfo/Idh/MocA family oxidoreductase [Abitibacteriaceae bacterium]|nr:Gfo/Idh/MocA family oxidoreductase [Abditibacteriaceae bacterium]
MSKLRIGVVGAGGIASAHLPHLSQRSDAVELVGVADVRPEAAAATAQKYGMAQHVTDYQELLPEVDAVLVCVPTFLHAEVAVAALNAGKAVFCEKPLARTMEQANAMLEAANMSGAALQVGFVRRFDDEWLSWRDAVLAEKIGRPLVWRDIMAGAGPASPWFNTDEQGGGPFLDGCIHNIDFALYTFGPVEWVFTHARTFRDSNTAIDTGTSTVRFQSGDEMLLAWSWGLPKDCGGGRIFEFLGPRGTLRWPQDEEAGATERKFVINQGTDKESVSFPSNALGIGFERQMDEFIAVAQGQQKPRADGEAGRAALQVALAILQSGRTQQIVRL